MQQTQRQFSDHYDVPRAAQRIYCYLSKLEQPGQVPMSDYCRRLLPEHTKAWRWW